MNGKTRGRALLLCVGLAVLFTVFSARLIYLQVYMHDECTAMAAAKHVDKQIIHSRRGLIRDLNGEILAANDPVRTVVVDGSLVNDVEGLTQLLSRPLGIESEELRGKLSADRRYLILAKKVPEMTAMELRQEMRTLGLRGVRFERSAERIYPNGEMLSHVLGFVNHEQKGVQGVEAVMDDYLRGHNGFRYIEHDRTGREMVPYRGQERPPRNGCNIRLTVDMGLQNIVETELNEAVKQFNPEWASVILMDPKTGAILALANRPSFDLNDLSDTEPAQMKNRAIIDMYEPGSVFKIVGAAGALNEGLVRSDTTIFCENGRFRYGGRVLRDHHGYGSISVTDILVKSSNIGSAKLALQLGDQRFYEYVRRFGFGERTGIGLPGEIGGLVHPPHRWSKISITRIPMGHEIGVTPLQVVTSMAVIANGGNLMMPQIVREILDEAGNVVTQFSPVVVRRVVAKSAADKVRDALVGVVSERGTAALAKVAGYNVAGKTGTAQKVKPDGGGYYNSRYVVSFVGFMPAEDPAFVCLVVLDDARNPNGSTYGGLVAGPIFSRIAERAARYLNLEPQPETLDEANFAATLSGDD